jgi:Molybdopterin converting factor, large subunit
VEFNGYVREHDIVDGREVPTSGLNIKDEVFFHLHEIREKAIEKFGLLEVLVYHNQGFLKVGERGRRSPSLPKEGLKPSQPLNLSSQKSKSITEP